MGGLLRKVSNHASFHTADQDGHVRSFFLQGAWREKSGRESSGKSMPL